MATLWHPDAKRQIFPKTPGKPWSGGSKKPKFGFHTTETQGFPRYSFPPHVTLQPGVELRQHIPFDLAAYSVRSSRVDTTKFFYQFEIVGFARFTNTMPDWWYEEVAELIMWAHDNLGVPLEFEDFSVMRWGMFAPQRRNYATVDAFSGILGHAHVGRGIDTHWDPGLIDVPRLEAMLDELAPPPPPPEEEEEEMLQLGDKAFAVAEYQKAFNHWMEVRDVNYPPGPLVVNMEFDEATKKAVNFYQRASQLDDTKYFTDHPDKLGTIGTVTADLLGQYDPDRSATARPHDHTVPPAKTSIN